MSMVARLGLAVALVVASARPVTSDPATPAATPISQLEETVAFLATAITPDQESIDYLASIDLRTGLAPSPQNDPLADPNDAHGRGQVPDCLCSLDYYTTQFLTFTADGRRLVGARVTCPPAIVVYDRLSGRRLRQLWHGGRVGGIALSPDGRTLAAAVCAVGTNRQRSGRVCLWDIDSGEVIGYVAVGEPVSAVAFMPDGQTLVTGGDDGLVLLWSRESGEQLRCIGKHNREVTVVAVAPDGRTVASGGNDRTIRLWNATDGKELHQLVHPKEMSFVTFSPDGRIVACVSGGSYYSPEGGTYLWDLATGKELPHFQHHPEASMGVGFSADGRLLATTDPKGVYLWEVATGLARHTVDSRTDTHRGSYGAAAALSPDGRALAATGSLNAVWDATGRSPNGQLAETRFTPRGLDDLWQSLGDREATAAHAAVWALVAARGASVELVRDRLAPATAVDLERVKRLIANLDEERFAVRQAAGRELERLDDVRVADLLRQVLANKPALEVQRRAERVLATVASVAHPERARAVRAVEVLERIGTPEARATLERLASGAADSYLTRAARSAVERLSKP